mgnify:CR=1 FL=1
MGKSSQRKGRAAERELAEILCGYGYAAKPGRALNYGSEADVIGLPGFHLEVKRCERLQLPAWIEQAERDAERMQDGVPVVIFRQNRQPWRVCLKLSEFLSLLGKGTGEEQAKNTLWR